MHKQIALLLLIFSSIFWFGFNSDRLIHKSHSANVSPTVTPTPDSSSDSVSIELDRDITSRPCPPSYRCRGNCDSNMSIVVTISDAKSENNQLNYNYTVSGGRIVGEGAKVNWDLMGASPGTYQIKIDVINNKSGNLLQSATKTITVEECIDDGDRCLVCPAFSVDAPTTPTQAGETMIFTANVGYGNAENMIYNWTISDGKIIEGQGTPTIKVATNRKMAGKVVKATANFKWDCSEICKNNTASASGLVATKKRKDK
ncbi:MAG: hypothetical protein M3367_04100 [Acidobacteriota bacterium]|nr:hypothetical protein [Acidobacteriota bacterium]